MLRVLQCEPVWPSEFSLGLRDPVGGCNVLPVLGKNFVEGHTSGKSDKFGDADNKPWQGEIQLIPNLKQTLVLVKANKLK